MLSRPELKRQALDTLRGKWAQPILATLIFLVLSNVAQSYRAFHALNPAIIGIFSGCSILITLFFLLNLQYGYGISFLRFNKGSDDSVKEMFNAGFSDYVRVLGVMLLTVLYTILWMLLLLIPGIIKAYAYSMTMFIAEEHPELSADECITRSMEMMKGHKWELFVLDLSFIGWLLLSIITLGIGLLWLSPYMELAHVKFYNQLKGGEVNDMMTE